MKGLKAPHGGRRGVENTPRRTVPQVERVWTGRPSRRAVCAE